MIVGLPKEIKADENRVAMVPPGVAAFVQQGHSVLVERGAGVGSGIPDAQYQAAGAQLIDTAREVWERAEMIVKVKEPQPEEIQKMRAGQILYTYLHLASDEALTRALLEQEVIAIAYETIEREDGSLPLLFPMSEVAGRLATQKGAQCMESGAGGAGVLLGGVTGVRPAKVVILGAGTTGASACQVAVGMGASVALLDINSARLRYMADTMQGRVSTVMANTANVEEEVADADLVICAVLVVGARAPQLINEALLKRMKPGSAIVDIAIDQGGCCTTSRPTTHHDPTYKVHDIIHYCVANMPGAVPRTSTYALTNVTLQYGLTIANKGVERALHEDAALRRGLNVCRGKVTHPAVAETFGFEYAAAV